jgi:hypothetical protein
MSAASSRKRRFDRAWIAVAIAMLLVAAIRVRLLQLPLERDEGEYAYMGQLMLQGIPPYSLAFNMKLPGTYAAYAAIMAVFGQTAGAIHLGLLIVNAAAIVMVFVLGRRLYGSTAGAVAAISYAVFAIQPGILGLSAHATHFVVLFALAGILALLKALDSRRSGMLFLAGALFGLAFLMKQPGGAFVLFGAGYLVWADRHVRGLAWRQCAARLALFALAAALPYGLTCLLLWRAGVFGRFWFWTVDCAAAYASALPLKVIWRMLRCAFGLASGQTALLWILAALGVPALLAKHARGERRVFGLGLLVFSALAVCSCFHFRNHYFILLLPAASLQVGIALDWALRAAKARAAGAWLRLLPIGIFAIACLMPFAMQNDVFFALSPTRASRRIFESNPFPESVRVADYIAKHTTPRDTIAVLGSEPQIYFYSHRHSATGYIYAYDLMAPGPRALGMQREMIRQIERAKPRYLVFMGSGLSWSGTKRSTRFVFRWLAGYVIRHCKLVGVVDIDPTDPDMSCYYWEGDLVNAPKSGDSIIYVYLRTS